MVKMGHLRAARTVALARANHILRRTSDAMVSAAAPVHVSRLELRHRALGLQRRRFWRELTYGAILSSPTS